MDEFQLAQLAINQLLNNQELLEIPTPNFTSTAFFEDPYALLVSLGQCQPHSKNLIFLDVPRASKRVKAQLPEIKNQGEIIWTEVAHNDPDYLFRLKANCLIVTRLALNCLAKDGLLLAVTTPDTYISVRTAIEQFMGTTKFLGELVYQTRTGGGNDSRYLDLGHENLLIFAMDPERVDRFQMQKDPDALKKYSESDENGRFYWDTYIRKQARNYYKIECPDGTFLEKEENGNRISWLWKESTFQQKLSDGEVKFEIRDGHWRLYYKDRLKELKILRSLVLNNTDLSEVSENASLGSTGSQLLTQRGSQEVNDFAGEKPEYLKSSGFFRFILEVFGNKGQTLIPFSEYGAAISAQLDTQGLNASLITNNQKNHQKLIEWRLKKLPKNQAKLCEVHKSLARRDFSKLDKDIDEMYGYIQAFVSNFDQGTSEWSEVSSDSHKLLVAEGSNLHVVVEYLGNELQHEPVDLLGELDELGFSITANLNIWSIFNEDLVRSSFSELPSFKFHHFPIFLLK
jgi:hypothetical protein